MPVNFILLNLIKARELQISSKISDHALEKETPGVFVSPNEPGRLISGVHSPQFESVLKAAEEFDKVFSRNMCFLIYQFVYICVYTMRDKAFFVYFKP